MSITRTILFTILERLFQGRKHQGTSLDSSTLLLNNWYFS